jgi:DNA-directed RNA polymerase subunit E'/Rpb7
MAHTCCATRWVSDATINRLTEHGFYATLDAPFVDVLCRSSALPYDRYELDRYGVRLRGVRSGRTFALGDRVRLCIEDVSIARRKVSGVPADATLRTDEFTPRKPARNVPAREASRQQKASRKARVGQTSKARRKH